MILSGKEAALALKEKLKEKYENKDITLAIVHFNDPASVSYLKARHKMGEFLNCKVVDYGFDPTNVSNDEVITLINKLNNDSSITGIIIDRPLPKSLDENIILDLVSTSKDVDGFSSNNLGRLFKGLDHFDNATAKAALMILEYYNIDVYAKNVLVIGRSINVGKPLSIMLLNKNATVQIAHSKTRNLNELSSKADIIFLCVGKKDFLTKEGVNENNIVIDIGINFDEEGNLCGDASKEIYDVVNSYSPVPGGVGVLTNVALFTNLLKAYELNNK